MVRLRTLGGLTVEADGRPVTGAGVQRRRLALLTLMASVAPRGMSREKIAALLWSASDSERARNVLSQAVFAIRRDFGQDAVLATAGTELRLNTDIVTCDRCDFETALARGNLEQAVDLYGGPFLDGFHIADAPEFERWTDSERGRLARRYADALEALASGASARCDAHGAARWWRRLAEVDPTNSRVALGFMQALAAGGDRAGAIQYARLHEILLRDELGIDPDDTVVALAERLRATPAASSPIDSARADRSSQSASVDATTPLVASAPTIEGEPPGASHGRPRWSRPVIGALLVAVAVAISVPLTLQLRAARGPDVMAPSTIAILPFSVRLAEHAYLADGLVDLISRNLDRAGELRAVDPRAILGYAATDTTGELDQRRAREVARHFAAGRYVLGEVIEAGRHLRISARVYQTNDDERPIGEARAEGDPRQLFQLVDRLTAELVAATHNRPNERFTRTAALTTASFEALKAYLEGEVHYRAGRWAVAIAAYQKAIEADTSFALANYRLSMAADWGGRYELVNDAARRAYLQSSRLSWRDSLFVHGYFAWRQGKVAEAEQLYREVLRHHRDDVESWYQLGEVLFHHNPNRGRSFTESREPFEQVLRFSPENVEVLSHLIRIAAREARREMIDSLARRAIALRRGSETLEFRALRASVLGDRADMERVLTDIQNADDRSRFNAVWRLAIYARDLGAAERVSRSLVDSSRREATRVTGHEIRSDILLARGRWAAAQRELDAAARLRASYILMRRALLAALPFVATPRAELFALRDSVDRWQPREGPAMAAGPEHPDVLVKHYLLGLLSARAGDTTAALHNAERLTSLAPARDTGSSAGALARSHAASLRAHVHWIGGRTSNALVALEPLRQGRATTRDIIEGYDRFMLAELLLESDRLQEAAGWYGSLGDFSYKNLPYIGPAHLRLAQIYERLGDAQRARDHRTRFDALWGGADPELRAVSEAMARGRGLARVGS